METTQHCGNRLHQLRCGRFKGPGLRRVAPWSAAQTAQTFTDKVILGSRRLWLSARALVLNSGLVRAFGYPRQAPLCKRRAAAPYVYNYADAHLFQFLQALTRLSACGLCIRDCFTHRKEIGAVEKRPAAGSCEPCGRQIVKLSAGDRHRRLRCSRPEPGYRCPVHHGHGHNRRGGGDDDGGDAAGRSYTNRGSDR
jgi:hypothetical protein